MDYEAMRADLVNAGVRAGTTDAFVSAIRETDALQLAILRARPNAVSRKMTTMPSRRL